MSRVVLSLCDRTGNMLRPWADSGYRCIAVDIQHNGSSTVDGIEFVGANVLDYMPPMSNYAACFAFPPRTHLAVSGARWFREKGMGKLIEALQIVERCRLICEWTGARYCLENPVSTLSTYWRKPDEMFDPYEYAGYIADGGEDYTKKTCLWTGGGFIMPEKRPVQPTLGSKMHLLPPSPDRADLRSETPRGFARAVFLANHQP